MQSRVGRLAMASAAALGLACQSASALDPITVGAWEVEISGNVNGFLTNVECDGGAGPVLGGLACGSFNTTDRDFGDIRTGLLPAWFGFHASHNTPNLNTGITIGFQPGIDGATGIAGAPIDGGLGLNSENLRQVFLEFGHQDWGTIKVGRDLGLFGSDAILSDMTLLGVGTVSDLTQGGGNTSLGRIGVGYVYADWKGQIQYVSPNWNGFSFALALVDPWGLVNLSGLSLDAGSFGQVGDTYGFEAKAGFDFGGANPAFGGRAWISGITQDLDSTFLPNRSATGLDFGIKVHGACFEVVGYVYDAEGVGTTDFLFDGIDLGGNERESDGFYGQVTWQAGASCDGTKLGVSIGESNLSRGAADPVATSLLDSNESVVLGVYHPISTGLSLVVEYTQTEATAHNGNKAEETSIALGAIFFY